MEPLTPLQARTREVEEARARPESSASRAEGTPPSSGELWDFLYNRHDPGGQVPKPGP